MSEFDVLIERLKEVKQEQQAAKAVKKPVESTTETTANVVKNVQCTRYEVQEYQRPCDALYAACSAHVRKYGNKPYGIVVPSYALPHIINDLNKMQGPYNRNFQFHGVDTVIYTEKELNKWLMLVFGGKMEKGVLYAIA